MPALDILSSYVCASCLDWSMEIPSKSGGEPYMVRYGKMHRGPYQYGYQCQCAGFKFSKGPVKRCSHVDIAKELHCQWGMGAFSGDVVFKKPEGGKCPECAGPLAVIQVGV